MHASSLIASTLHCRFCSHFILFVDIQFSFVDSSSFMHASPHHLCHIQPLCHLRFQSPRRRHLISFMQSYPNSWYLIHHEFERGVNRHVVHYICTSCEACGSLYLKLLYISMWFIVSERAQFPYSSLHMPIYIDLTFYK